MSVTTDSAKGVQVSLTSDLLKLFRRNIQTYAIIIAMVAIWIFFAFMTDGNYLSAQNFSNLFRQMTVTAFLAIGMVLVIVTGNIDLSVGKLAGFVSVVVAYFQASVWTRVMPDMPIVAATLSVFIGIGVGALFGVLQGYIISFLNVPSFIVTLGGMFVLNGAILLVTQGKTIPANQPAIAVIAQGYLPAWAGWLMAALVVAYLFFNMFRSRQKKKEHGFELPSFSLDIFITAFFAVMVVGYVYVVNKYNGVQIPVLLLAIATVLMSYMANNTRFGRYAYAIGGNREAARLSGINIRKRIFQIFVLMGVLCGVGGVVLASYVGYGTIAAGQGYELDAIAAAILGGTSTLGGVGTVWGAIIGALIMSSLSNGLQLLNVQPSWQYLLKGMVLVLAVYADVTFKKSR
ncbi:MAG: Xylose transport system permease protein XylH [Anaerolineae bacterium]|nr:Xylose transport system permease protein XylH [Anaerolineae bacterium]